MRPKSLALIGLPVLVVLLFFLMGQYSADTLMDAAAYRPFAYRVLTWWALRLLIGVGLSPIQAAAIIGAVSLVGFVAALRWLAAGVGVALSPGQVGLLLMGLIVLMLGGSQLYDLPTLALFTACLAALANRRWFAYGLLFVLAALNRETAILLTVVYALYAGWGYGLMAQVAAYALVQLSIRTALAGLPGTAVQEHWLMHVQSFRPDIEMAVLYVFLLAGVLVLAAQGYAAKPRLLKVAAWVIGPVLLILYFAIGYPFELRVFHEAYPALALLALSGRG